MFLSRLQNVYFQIFLSGIIIWGMWIIWPSQGPNTEVLFRPDKHKPCRVFAVITGGWSLGNDSWTWKGWASDTRRRYLAEQLDRYAAACEMGFDVVVGVVTYHPWNASQAVDLSRHFCYRILSSVPSRVYLFPYESLSNTTMGTAGNIMFQHRKLFLQEQENYDLFVSQEDDVVVNFQHMNYFLKWSSIFRGTDFVPAFAPVEIATWSRMVHNDPLNHITPSLVMFDIRMKQFNMYRWKRHDLVTSRINHDARMYMVTQDMLRNATSRHEWLSSLHTVKGEFNVYFGHSEWLAPYYRMAIPVADITYSMINHLPANYMGDTQRLNGTDEGVPVEEWLRIVAKCVGSFQHLQSLIHQYDKHQGIVHDLPFACHDCLTQSMSFVSITIDRKNSLVRPTHAQYKCRPLSQLSWPGDTNSWDRDKRWPDARVTSCPSS